MAISTEVFGDKEKVCNVRVSISPFNRFSSERFQRIDWMYAAKVAKDLGWDIGECITGRSMVVKNGESGVYAFQMGWVPQTGWPSGLSADVKVGVASSAAIAEIQKQEDMEVVEILLSTSKIKSADETNKLNELVGEWAVEPTEDVEVVHGGVEVDAKEFLRALKNKTKKELYGDLDRLGVEYRKGEKKSEMIDRIIAAVGE